MSKAFTRESDDAPEDLPHLRPAALPPGAKNYMTAKGFEKLRQRLQELTLEPDSPARRLRLHQIQEQLQTAVVVNPPSVPWGQVQFGATVIVRNQQDEEGVYRIVGVDETDSDHDISWLSPVAKALMKAQVGDQVPLRTPSGNQTLKIIKIYYE